MSKQSLQQCKSGKDFIKFAQTHGALVRNGHGSHMIIRTGKGSTVVPYHNHDLGTGLRVKLVKAFAAIGLAGLLMACIVPAILN